MDAEGLKELFEPFGAVAVRRMFSGYGVYADGLCFALNLGGEVYLKADAETEAEFAAVGSTPFVYQGRTRPVKMGFWRLMASAYDDADELRRWSGLALAAARRAARSKAAKAKPAKTKPGKAKTTPEKKRRKKG
jgi:DNA transformation protein